MEITRESLANMEHTFNIQDTVWRINEFNLISNLHKNKYITYNEALNISRNQINKIKKT